MKSSILIACALVLAPGLGACDKKEGPAPESTAVQTAAAAPAPPPAPAAVKVDLDSIPAEEQFESEVEKEVTPANFEQKLDALDKELAAEK